MFYAPKIDVATLAPMHDEIECYSDYHKEAFGCRPRGQYAQQPTDPIERARVAAELDAWFVEGERIHAMRIEVARFNFARRMEYLQRRGDAQNAKEALREIIEEGDRYFFKREDCDWASEDWESACYDLGLPYSDAPKLKAIWEA